MRSNPRLVESGRGGGRGGGGGGRRSSQSRLVANPATDRVEENHCSELELDTHDRLERAYPKSAVMFPCANRVPSFQRGLLLKADGEQD